MQKKVGVGQPTSFEGVKESVPAVQTCHALIVRATTSIGSFMFSKNSSAKLEFPLDFSTISSAKTELQRDRTRQRNRQAVGSWFLGSGGYAAGSRFCPVPVGS
jgi:hypothetical protein